jgi:hypothetical protein
LQVLECLSAQGLTSSVGSSTEGILGSIGNTGSYSGTTSKSVIKARLGQDFNVLYTILLLMMFFLAIYYDLSSKYYQIQVFQQAI